MFFSKKHKDASTTTICIGPVTGALKSRAFLDVDVDYEFFIQIVLAPLSPGHAACPTIALGFV